MKGIELGKERRTEFAERLKELCNEYYEINVIKFTENDVK